MTWLKRWWARRVLSMNGVCHIHFLPVSWWSDGYKSCPECYRERLAVTVATAQREREVKNRRVAKAREILKGTK